MIHVIQEIFYEEIGELEADETSPNETSLTSIEKEFEDILALKKECDKLVKTTVENMIRKRVINHVPIFQAGPI